MTEFTKEIIKIIQSIPSGKVLTYGGVAMLAGNHQAARTVVWVLNSAHATHQLPWYRVINAKGEIALKGEGKELQQQLLEAEGVTFDAKGRIDLDIYRWNGN